MARSKNQISAMANALREADGEEPITFKSAKAAQAEFDERGGEARFSELAKASTPDEAPADEEKPKRGRAKKIRVKPEELDLIVHITTPGKTNPKRKGRAPFARFELYKDGEMTVREALEAGVWEGDIEWDQDHGFIVLLPKGEPAPQVEEQAA